MQNIMHSSNYAYEYLSCHLVNIHDVVWWIMLDQWWLLSGKGGHVTMAPPPPPIVRSLPVSTTLIRSGHVTMAPPPPPIVRSLPVSTTLIRSGHVTMAPPHPPIVRSLPVSTRLTCADARRTRVRFNFVMSSPNISPVLRAEIRSSNSPESYTNKSCEN